jgi:broad specificity phosphatase PhoE
MRVFLARHGETDWNAEHRLQGRSDTHLTARGRAHARALCELLAGETIDVIYTSTLRRSIDTAAPLAAARGVRPEARPELEEISYGILEGHAAHELDDPKLQALWEARRRDKLRFRAPGGESYEELRARIAPFTDELRRQHAGDSVLIVGHRATNRVILGLLLGLSLEETIRLKQKHDCVLEIRPEHTPSCMEHRYAPVAEPGGNP